MTQIYSVIAVTYLYVCSQTHLRPMSGFASYFVKSCTLYLNNTSSIFVDLGMMVKVTTLKEVFIMFVKCINGLVIGI